MDAIEEKKLNRKLLIRSFGQMLVIGLLTVIVQDKKVLDYFLSTEIILQILFFTIVGGLLFYWITRKILQKRRNKGTRI